MVTIPLPTPAKGLNPTLRNYLRSQTFQWLDYPHLKGPMLPWQLAIKPSN